MRSLNFKSAALSRVQHIIKIRLLIFAAFLFAFSSSVFACWDMFSKPVVQKLSIRRNEDLSDQMGYPDAKRDICEHIRGTGESIRDFCKNHNLNEKTVYGWMQKYDYFIETGKDTFHGFGGRPKLISDEAMINVKKKIIDEQLSQNSQKNKRKFVIEKLGEAVAETQKQRGLEVDGKPPSRSQIKVIFQQENFGKRKVQYKTQARIFAESDPRNAYSFAAMNHAFIEDKSPHMTFNWDATQVVIGEDGNMEVVFIKHDMDNYKVGAMPLTAESTGTLGMAIKYLHFHNAAGNAAPPVYIIADPSLGEDEFVWEEIPNFGNTADVGTVGYIVACKTRNCNAAFYRWYGTTIVEPFVQKCRTINECKNLDGTPERAFVTCDGEASQISVFQEEQMLALFVEALIDFGKSPASCSATCQSSDASVFFKALKAKLKSVSKEMAANGALEKRLKDFIEKKLINADGSPHFSSERKTQTVGSLLIFSYTVKETLRGELIRDGYREIGQYPLNFRKTMGKCVLVNCLRVRWK